MIRLSIVIITYNEERNLARCLDSVKEIADEIVVVDSYSTDKTVAIAENYNARVIKHPFIGYGEQKNFATQQASNDWVLSLDADETLTPELQHSIMEVKMDPAFPVYQMSRLTNYCGKWIKYCGWYPDKQTRLYKRTKGKWEEPKVHEYWRLDNDKEQGGTLKGDILHYSFRTINEHLKKIEKYSELAARESVENGKTATLFKIFFSPKWHFINEFIFQLGFLDGFYGYTICRLSVYATFLKYSKIRLYYKQKVSAEARALKSLNS
jgi:glycosyltransferase involved in cell wall biosynthesis